MIFISAGHNTKSIKPDPGAVGNGYKEADLTIEIRDLVCQELDRLGIPYVKDSDSETLSQYLKRINTGSASCVLEFHFDSAASDTATGATALIEGEADRLDRAFASELVDVTSKCLGIKNRGVISETESHRGRLGLMREDGIICLLEVCFISNKNDIEAYHCTKQALAMLLAPIIKKYEDVL